MIRIFFIFMLGFVVLFSGNPLLAVAAAPTSVRHALSESRPDGGDKILIPPVISFSTSTAGIALDANEQTALVQAAVVGAAHKPSADPRLQLVAQLPRREQDATPRGPSDKELSHELSIAQNSLQQAKQRIDELERQLAEGNLENAKRRIGELVIQLHAKETELSALRATVHENSKKFREDLAAQTEDLAQAKRRLAEVEQQMAATGKDYESTQAKRRATEFEQQLVGKEQDLTQAKRRTTEAEQQAAGKEQELVQAKRRIADLEQQIAAKEQESAQAKRRAAEAEQQTAGKTPDPTQAKKRVADLEQLLAGKEYESAQAKRRATELEQQTAAKEQELAQTKRRIAELEQQTAGKEQDPAQIKRRLTELEQQMLGKEQELVQIRDNLKQVTQKYADLGPMLMDRDAEIARTKRLLEDLERSLPKPDEGLPSLEVSPAATNMAGELPPDANLSVTDLPIPGTSAGDGTDAGSLDLTKIGEALSGSLGEELKRGTVALRQERTALTLALVSSELFPPGEATVTPGGNSLIGQIGAVLQKFRYRHIEVTAHTDTKPIRNDARKLFRDNLELSRARVEQASQALINSGVDADRVKAVVYTAAKSLDNDESRNRNRRIEIVVSTSLATHSPQGKLQPGKKPPQSISLSSPRRP